MANPEYRDRDASQRSLRNAIDGLGSAPPAKLASEPSASAQRLQAWSQHVTPLRLTMALVGLTAAIIGSALL